MPLSILSTRLPPTLLITDLPKGNLPLIQSRVVVPELGMLLWR